MEEKNKPNKNKGGACPSCNISEETIEKLKEAARQKEKREDFEDKNGRAKDN